MAGSYSPGQVSKARLLETLSEKFSFTEGLSPFID